MPKESFQSFSYCGLTNERDFPVPELAAAYCGKRS